VQQQKRSQLMAVVRIAQKRSRILLLFGGQFLLNAVVWPSTCDAQIQARPSISTPVEKLPAPASSGPHLKGELVTLPLILVDGYPFIEGAINGKQGKLLLDIGEAEALVIDSHTVTPPNGVAIGRGFFGSGQTFESYRFPLVDELTLPENLHYTNLINIHGNPGLPLEQHITPDFIGWIGINFFENYVMKLNEAQSSVSFYHNVPMGVGEDAAMAGEQIVQAITFETVSHRSIATFPVTVGGLQFVASVDTGSHTVAWLSHEQVKSMEMAGTLKDEGGGQMLLSGVLINGHPLSPMKVQISIGKPPFAKLLHQPDVNMLQFGHELLSRYKVVWDYDRGTLILLEP
jgi:hypothetical protein